MGGTTFDDDALMSRQDPSKRQLLLFGRDATPEEIANAINAARRKSLKENDADEPSAAIEGEDVPPDRG